MSCETCHVLEQGWADGLTRSPKHGRTETLEAAVDLMLAGGVSNPVLDEKLVARRLTPEQLASLLAFLAALAPDASTLPAAGPAAIAASGPW